jgi:hypothetical protein
MNESTGGENAAAERKTREQKVQGFHKLRNFFPDATAAATDALKQQCSKEECVMRKLSLALATGALLIATVPASAQIYGGVDPGGAGVQVGPFGFGVGPRYDYGPGYDYGYRGDAYSAYGADCPLVRERVHTADGRVIIRTHRVCR